MQAPGWVPLRRKKNREQANRKQSCCALLCDVSYIYIYIYIQSRDKSTMQNKNLRLQGKLTIFIL
jgi:hypothetical protein